MRWLAATATAAVLAVAAVVLATPASAASLVEVTNFGTNPTNLRMHLYVPDNIGSGRPAILVAVHYCTGSGPAFFSGTQFAQLADQYKFIVIYPSATRSGQCFDVSSPGALTHNGNSDPVGIVSMVRWVINNRNGDTNRVYVTGASSGGMMTNVLLGDYPDVFKAGAAFMGVPFGCFATTDGSMWNTQCANGQRIMTPQQWGDLVRNAFPGFTGARPRMQVFHGTTDTTLQFPNFGEEIKQWTNVLGVSQTPSFTDTPQSGWTRTRYGGTGVMPPVEGIRVDGVGHSLPLSGQAAMAIAFFGLNNQPPTTPPTTPPVDNQPPSVPGTPAAGTVTSSSISLSWSPSTDNVGVTGYDVFRAPGASGGTFASVGTSASASFTDSNLPASSTFRYQVRARDAAGNTSGFSAASPAITTTGGGGGGCSASGAVQNQWDTGYVINPVTIRNNGASTINGWTVTITLPAGHTYVGSWNATVTVSGQTITARNISWNGSIPAGGTITSFGFQATRPGGNTAVPSAYTCTSP